MPNNNRFAADVSDWVRETDQRMLDMLVYALDDMVNDMQVPTGKGGKMRVKTGFLRLSGRASLNGMPTGNGTRPADAKPGQFQWDGKALSATLLEMKLGDTFYWGWVANYAQVREVYDGFMAAPIQNWQSYVNAATDKVKKDHA